MDFPDWLYLPGGAMHEFRTTILGADEAPATPIASKAKKAQAASLGGLTGLAIKRTEARLTNHRCEDRLRDILDETTIVFRRKKQCVRVVNVSSRGAMIECAIQARIGEKLDILFTEKNKTACVVRWVREGRIGVEFVDETIFWDATQTNGPVFRDAGKAPEQTSPRAVSDREPRQKLLRNGTLYWSGISIPVRLRNISAGGARIDSEQVIVAGAEVELDLGEAGFQYAEVRWAKDGQVGLRFATDFNLDTLAPAAASAPAAPDVLKPAYLETETRPDSPWAARFERLTLTDLKRP